jgi:predicted aconitase
MFHIAGVTPEAATRDIALGGAAPRIQLVLGIADMMSSWSSLDSSNVEHIELVALGNPHFSLTECAKLAAIVESEGGEVHKNVDFVVTLGRDIKRQSDEAGYTTTLEKFGVSFITDTCWCMLTEPVVPVGTSSLITNSGKYAHYAPGLVHRKIRFSSLNGCVKAARTGRVPAQPTWAQQQVRIRSFSSFRRIAQIIR